MSCFSCDTNFNHIKEIKYNEAKALIFMAEPNKGEPHSYPDLDKDIKKWAQLYGWTIINKPNSYGN